MKNESAVAAAAMADAKRGMQNVGSPLAADHPIIARQRASYM